MFARELLHRVEFFHPDHGWISTGFVPTNNRDDAEMAMSQYASRMADVAFRLVSY